MRILHGMENVSSIERIADAMALAVMLVPEHIAPDIRWVRDKSLKGFKDKVREKTKRTRGESLRTIIDDLTPMIRGWFGYFKHAGRTTFKPLDQFIRRRLRALLRKQEKRPGMGRCHDDHRRWPNAYFANLGLFTMEAAHRASQSR